MTPILVMLAALFIGRFAGWFLSRSIHAEVRKGMRRQVAVAATVWLLSVAPSRAQSSAPEPPEAPIVNRSPQEIFASVSPSIFVVQTYNRRGALIASGSAVAVDQHTAITNCHVLRPGTQWTLNQNGRHWSVSISRRNDDHDLCEIVSEPLQAVPVKIRDSSEVKIGERVFTIGAPLGLESTLSEGLVSGLRAYKDGKVIQTTAPISPGSSGGGLFDDQGRLIGITSFGLRDSQSLNFALPSKWVLSLDAKLTPAQVHSDDAPAVSHANDAFGNVMEAASTALNAKSYDEAGSLYRHALELHPDDVTALTALGTIDLYQEKPSAAQTLCSRAVTLDSKSADGWGCLGDAYVSQGLWDSAEVAFRKALALKPTDCPSWVGLGQALAMKGDKSGVLQVYQTLKPLNPDIANWFFQSVAASMGLNP